MKTKLLKLALCAMALLPMGAWAETTNIFTFEMQGSDDISMSAGTTGNVNLVSNNYATVTGGSVDYYQAQSGNNAVTGGYTLDYTSQMNVPTWSRRGGALSCRCRLQLSRHRLERRWLGGEGDR